MQWILSLALGLAYIQSLSVAFVTPLVHRSEATKTAIKTDLQLPALNAIESIRNREDVSQPLAIESIRNREDVSQPLSVESLRYLSSIVDYGNARMAGKAVNILENMPTSAIAPEHYTEAIWACAKSDQFELAVETFEAMKELGLARSTRTYEALAACAEKTDHCEETLELLQDLKREGLKGSKELFNSCMWAADKVGQPELAVKLLTQMEEEGIERDRDTYSAAAWACEKQGDGTTAMHILDLMRAEKVQIDTIHYRGAMWALVRGGRWNEALQIFDDMRKTGALHDDDCFNAAIWACAMGALQADQLGPRCPNSCRAVQLLRLMKLEGFKRCTVSFDGTLSALSKAGDWEQALAVFTWMDRDVPVVPKSAVTYQVVIEALDAAGQGNKAMELYLAAMRQGFFVPWVGGTRTIDLRGMSLPIAKCCVRNILSSMREGRLNRFQLDMIMTGAYEGGEGEGWQFEQSTYNIMELVEFLLQESPVNVLVGDVRIEKGTADSDPALHVFFTQEVIDEWCVSSPFDSRKPNSRGNG